MADFMPIKDCPDLLSSLTKSDKIGLSPAPSETGAGKVDIDVVPAPGLDSVKKAEGTSFQQSLDEKEMQALAGGAGADAAAGVKQQQTPRGTIQDLLNAAPIGVEPRNSSARLLTSRRTKNALDFESDDFWEDSESELDERAGVASLVDVGTSRGASKRGGPRQSRSAAFRRAGRDDEKENSNGTRRGKPYYHKLGTDFHTKDSISFAKKIDANQLNSIFNLFQEQMATLEGEYDRARENLQSEYEEAYEEICAMLDDERTRLHKIKERGRDIKAQVEFERDAVLADKKKVLAIREKLTSDRHKMEAEHESAMLKLSEERERLVSEMEAKDVELKAEAKRIANEQRKFADQVEDLANAKRELEQQKAAVQGERSGNVSKLEDEKDALASDIREFETYKAEVDQLLETKQLIIKEEKEEFIKTRAGELQAIEQKQSELEAELQRAKDIRQSMEDEQHRVETDWTQKGSYLEIHTKQLEEERRRFDEEKQDHERQLEAERAKLKEQIVAVERFQDANASLIEQDKKKLIAERDRLLSEMQVERRHMENERIESAKKIYELGQQLKRAQEMGASSANATNAIHAPAMNNLYTPATAAAPPPPALPPTSTFAFQPTPMRSNATPVRAQAGAPPPSMVDMSPLMDISGRLPTIKVYVGTHEDRNLLGEVALGPNITLGDLRRMIQAQFRLTSGFSLKKKKIPIRPSQDHHRAHDFIKGVDDYLVVD